MTRVKARGLLLVALLATGLSGWILSPILQRPDQTLPAYAHPGDAMVSAWSSWVRVEASKGRWELDRVPLVGAPEGINFNQNPPEPAVDGPQVLLAKMLGEITAFNLHLWLTFPLSAMAMYLLLMELGLGIAASVLGGVLFSLIPYHLAHSVHLSLASIQWLPLSLYALFRLWNQPSRSSILILAGSILLSFWSTAYYGFLSAVMLPTVIILWTVFHWGQRTKLLQFWRQFSLAGALGLGCGLIPYIRFFQTITSNPSLAFGERYAHPIKQWFVHCAKPWDYLLPSVHHPWFGSSVKPFVESHLFGSNVVEQSLYVGWGVLLLAAVALWRSFKRRKVHQTSWIIASTLGGLALVAAWFSGPPFVPIGAFEIQNDTVIASRALHLPSSLLRHLLPAFRVYARFGIVVGLALIPLSMMGWATLWRWAQGQRLRQGLCWVVAGLLLLDYGIQLPYQSLEPTPKIYQWLRELPGDPLIAEYPLLPSSHSIHAEYLNAQRTHQKRLVNGFPEMTSEGQAKRLKIANIQDAKAQALLRRIRVNYVIVHPERYAQIKARPKSIQVFGVHYDVPQRHWDEQLPSPPSNIPGLVLVARKGSSRIYRLGSRSP